MEQLPAMPPQLLAAIVKVSEAHGVPLNLLAGIAWVESRYNSRAYNEKSRAAGAFQITPDTAATLKLADPYDVESAADAAARFLAHQHRAFGQGGWLYALAAYNWGPANVRRHPRPMEWPDSVRAYALRVREAGDAARLPFDGDVLMVSRSQRSLARSPSLLLPALRGRGADQ